MKQWLHKKPMRPMQKPMPREMELPSGISNQAMLSMLESQGMQTAPRPASGGTPLDEAMRVKFERQFGLPMGDVRVHHNSDEPAKFGAGAYTYGTDVFIRPGQEKLLNHEMTHVAQQELGQVRPTGIEHGMAVNRSPVLEHSADMGTVPQMAGGATSPVVQCAEGERTQEIIDEKLREMAQPPLPAAAAAEPATKMSQRELANLTAKYAGKIFQTGSHGDGKGPQEEGGFSIDVEPLKDFLKKMLFQRYQLEEQTQIGEIIEKLEFKALPFTKPTTPEEKERYDFGTAYYHSDDPNKSHEIFYRIDPDFYTILPQLNGDYERFTDEEPTLSLSKTQYGFLAALLHEVGHAVQRNLLGHNPLEDQNNIPLSAHEYHNILMHENIFPFRKRCQYYLDRGTSAETSAETQSRATDTKMTMEEKFRVVRAIIYKQLESSAAMTAFPTIIDDFPELKKTLPLLTPPKNLPDSSPMDSAIGTAAIDKKDTATATVDSDKVSAAADETKVTEKPSSALQPSAQETVQPPPPPPLPKEGTAPQARKGAYAAIRAANQDKEKKRGNEKAFALAQCLEDHSATINAHITELKAALLAYYGRSAQKGTSETPSQEKDKLVIQKVIKDVLENYSTLDKSHQGIFLMEFLASLFTM